MALDGSCNFSSAHNWHAQESRKLEHGVQQKEAVEENMVVLLYARPLGRARHAETYPSKGRRLRCAHAHGG